MYKTPSLNKPPYLNKQYYGITITLLATLSYSTAWANTHNGFTLEQGDLVVEDGKVGIGTSSRSSHQITLSGFHINFGATHDAIDLNSDGFMDISSDAGALYTTYEDASPYWNFIEYDDPIIFRGRQTQNQDQKDVIFSFFNGNVGIGTTNPSRDLHIHGDYGLLLESKTVNGPTSVNLKSNTNGRWHISGPRAESGSEGDLRFYNYDSSDNFTGVPLTIKQNGNVGIGTTSPDYKLHVNGTAYATGAAGSLSDARHKKNINTIPSNSLETLGKLRPVTFAWKEPKDSGMQGRQFGFIAQEVEKILPEAVLTQDNNEQTKGIKYSTLIPILTKAIQDLTNKNEELTARIEALEKQR